MNANKYKWITGFVLMALLTGSCKKNLLDIYPSNALSDVNVFSDIANANRFLSNVYGTLPNGFARRDQGPGDGGGWSRGMTAFSMATDDAECNNLAGSTHGLNQGVLPTTWAYVEDIWWQNYGVIRKANLFMEKIDAVPGDDATKKRMKAEAQFLRAFCYEELVKCFGGVPLILKAGTPEESIIPRNSYDECVTQILKDCDESAAALPVTYPASDLGRATKVAALALKARVLLYKASPLFGTSSAALWLDAANAAKAVMVYGPAPGSGEYGLYPDYYKLFMDKVGNKEVIFARKFQNPSINPSDGARPKWYMSVPGVNDGAWGGYAPTQNLVDAYEMKNGSAITDAGSGYNPQDPYTNRDTRLDKSILHQGSKYKAGVIIETYRGGNTNNTNRLDSSKTGYGLMKMVDTSKYGAAGGADNDWIFIRYAEVLLNYAEAQNEAAGPDATVYQAINMVRARSGQPPLSGLSQAQLRDKIRNERRVELSFEEHRFFDVRRWKLGSTYFQDPVRKVSITKNPDNSLNYSYPVWEQRIYKDFQNLLPIPQSEIDKNPKLVQNLGYTK